MSLENRLDKAGTSLYEGYQKKQYCKVADKGLELLREFKAFDRDHTASKNAVEACCPIVSFTGQSLEKLDRPEEALDLYWWIIQRGCMGMLPFTRCAVLLERQKAYEQAIGVCDAALSNTWFNPPTAKGAKEEFTKRKQRLEGKLKKQAGNKG